MTKRGRVVWLVISASDPSIENGGVWRETKSEANAVAAQKAYLHASPYHVVRAEIVASGAAKGRRRE